MDIDDYDKPSAYAKPLNQGKEDTCTLFAVVNAACNSLMSQDIDVKQDLVAGGLLQLVDHTKGKLPTEFHGMQIKNMVNEKTGEYGRIELDIREIELHKFKQNISHVLVYPPKPTERKRHAVFVDKLHIDKESNFRFVCVNSHGEKNQYPKIDFNQRGNQLYEVNVDWKMKNTGNDLVIGIQHQCTVSAADTKDISTEGIEILAKKHAVHVKLMLQCSSLENIHCKECKYAAPDKPSFKNHMKSKAHAREVIKSHYSPRAKLDGGWFKKWSSAFNSESLLDTE